jgi:hypothetical protein
MLIIFAVEFLGRLIYLLLQYQTETESGSAGEQPVRDRFDA